MNNKTIFLKKPIKSTSLFASQPISERNYKISFLTGLREQWNYKNNYPSFMTGYSPFYNSDQQISISFICSQNKYFWE